MFSHLRYLALASLLIIAAGSYFFAAYFKDFRSSETVNYSQKMVKNLTTAYTQGIWERYGASLAAAEPSPYLGVFQQESDRYFKSQSIDIVTIFSTDSRRGFYSNSGNVYPSQDGSTRIQLFGTNDLALGKAVVRQLSDVQFIGSSDPNKHRTVLQIIIPLPYKGDATPTLPSQALLEAYVDVTDSLAGAGRQLFFLIGGFAGCFALLVGSLIFIATRAEAVITKQHEVNLELIAAAAQAEAQSRDKSQFLASVSHELRTPLNAIIGFSDIIRNEVKDQLAKQHQEYIDDINASGKHLLSLINDILDFSKAEAGKLQIEWAETDISKVIRNSLRMVLPRAEAAQVTLVEDLPSSHLVLVTDAKKFKQVLLNLLSNAVKFTPAGGEVRCHAWVDLLSGAISVQVRDTGIGIAPKDISRVMTPFGQVDSALSRRYEGTGLGLPLAKKFVESMGGVFTIESELKVGTSVTVTLPKAPPGWGATAEPAQKEKA